MRELWLSPDFVADPYADRAQSIDRAGEFGSTFTHEDETHSYAALAPAALAANEQLELDLPGYSLRAAIRAALADKIAREVLPLASAGDEWLERYPERLRLARQSGQWGLRLNDGKLIAYWDNKAALARLCPDDAREEAMRLRRRVQPAHDELRKSGHRFLYAVFTMPNSAAGELRNGMAAIYRRFRDLLRARRPDGELLFPQIKGALAVLEAPLGRRRDWNVHLNVLLPVKGFLDFAELRHWWRWNVEMRWIPDAPGAFQGAFAELIKYAVAATVSKSAEHASDGSTRAPPMLEWTGDELLEWLRAMHGFRRTRSYGALYGLDEPESEEVGPVVWLGTVTLQRGRYVHRCALLDSIPEDKFSGMSAAERWLALKRALIPGGLAGAGELGESDAVRSSTRLISNL